MTKYLVIIYFFIFIVKLLSNPIESLPIKFISGCEIDLDKNGEADLALLIESSDGCKLIVLMKFNGIYKSYALFDNCNMMNLSCKYGFELRETSTGNSKGKIYNTNGTYIVLSQPEGSKMAFFWSKNKFKQIWISG